MPKERVVVFDGEDKFIAPRNMVYDKMSGEAQVVGVQSPELPDNPVSSGAKKEFDDYMRRQGQGVTIPNPQDPDFCLRIKQFIQSNGNGLATPQQVMEAYNLFQANCVEKPKETPIVPPVEPPVEVPKPSPIVDAPAPTPEPPAPTPTPSVPTPSAPAPSLVVPLNVPTLGVPPLRVGGAASGGGGGEKEEPKKRSNWLIWLLIGGAALYFLTRKKD